MKTKLKKQIVSIGLIIAIIATIFIPITALADTGNNEDDTGILYVPIGSENFLSLMSISTPIKHYVLTEDIVISGDWKPISGFTGTFDGGGHTITFNIDKSTGAFVKTQYLGLFASCTDATIKNLYVNGNISLTTCKIASAFLHKTSSSVIYFVLYLYQYYTYLSNHPLF